ncbi:MAG TPA: response regulator [Polyangia bacterium]|nr:response regulator [Polyangia bacterium]
MTGSAADWAPAGGPAPVAGAGPKPLRVLLVEDDPNDSELIRLALQRGGYKPVLLRVETAADLRRALLEQQWDVVLSDYSLPSFSGPDAFGVLRETGFDIPFLIVSGTVGEEVAVDAMRAGVHDFLLKGHLGRLVAAIERELREAEVRTERRKMEKQLLISERMASVGTLAAGIVHEINNPLSVMSGNLDVLQRQFEVVADALAKTAGGLPPGAHEAMGLFREAAADAAEAAQRVLLITRDLRLFSHPDEAKREAVDIHKVLESSVRMAQSTFRGRARLVRRFGGDVPLVEGHAPRLGQVFVNLLVNAAQAIPDGTGRDHSITLATSWIDGQVVVEVSDTGVGIPADALPHIFDVFFTTKPAGIGTGLGLAICHRILTDLGGTIDVHSHPGEGTTVRVRLRRARTGTTSEVPAQAPAAVPDRRTASILIVEDEPALRRVLPRLLAPHRVTVVDRGRDGLERLLNGSRFDVILCDVMMPEMNGMQFYQELARVRPDLAERVVFMSGGVFSPTVRSFFDEIPNRRVEKPLDIPALRRLVDDMAGDG